MVRPVLPVLMERSVLQVPQVPMVLMGRLVLRVRWVPRGFLVLRELTG
jgi:hypothetical protein